MADWSSPTYWEHCYSVADTPWELGGVSSVLQEALTAAQASGGASLTGATVLVPGCGSGADSIWLAQQGAQVTAVDFSALAVSQMQRRVASLPAEVVKRITIRQADFFTGTASGCSLVAEHTFFCAIDPGCRERYARAVARALIPGGLLVGNFFVLTEQAVLERSSLALHGGDLRPPFVTSAAELRHLFSSAFEELVLQPANNPSPDRRRGLEWIGVFRRRS